MGTLRIIAGELKGRRIRVPDLPGVRPTSERAREALFSILGAQVVGADVLDACAGSGALGFEALSRGARTVSFVEADRRVLDRLRETAEQLGVARRCRFLAGQAESVTRLGSTGGPFDLILADPPYDGKVRESLLEAIAASRLLAESGHVVLERDARSAPAGVPGAGLVRVRTERYGRNCFDFYRRAGP